MQRTKNNTKQIQVQRREIRNKEIKINSKQNKIFAIVGPSCTYKTGIGIRLAQEFPFEIISCDSRLIYKYMDIGTAKPSLEERKNIPHHLIDIVEPNEDFTVSQYKNLAKKIIDDIYTRNKIPLFVGGTGLYLDSIIAGLSIPMVEPDTALRKELETKDLADLHKMLEKIDNESAQRIHPNDRFRIIRAIEVTQKTGKKFSLQREIKEPSFDVEMIGLTFNDREKHSDLLKKRVEKMLKNGFIDEVKFLVNKYGKLELFKKTIGYAEVVRFLDGELTKEKLVDEITISTRQYTKRQRTWFKKHKDIIWINLDEKTFEDAYQESVSFLTPVLN